MTLEGDIQSAILVAVTALPGAFFQRSNTGFAVTGDGRAVRFNRRGTPDIPIGCYRGRSVAIECKTKRGVLSDDQRNWRDAWVRAGGVYIVGRSVDAVLAELAAIP